MTAFSVAVTGTMSRDLVTSGSSAIDSSLQNLKAEC